MYVRLSYSIFCLVWFINVDVCMDESVQVDVCIWMTLAAVGITDRMSVLDSLDDWLLRERFIFFGWSGLLLFP